MADVLSQSEIDALLKQLSSGELDVDGMNDEPAVKIKDYDFARPAKFSKEHFRTLEIIFEHFEDWFRAIYLRILEKMCR